MSKREWKKTAAWCPGIGKGELVQIETARELRAGDEGGVSEYVLKRETAC